MVGRDAGACLLIITIVLLGNKKELESDRKVSYDEGLDFARKNKLIFFETSAKTEENVDQTDCQF